MLTDRQRIEYALIPALLESYILPLHKKEGKHQEILDILQNEYRSYANTASLLRRMNRMANKIIRYTVANKFDSRKAILAITSWLAALIEAGALEINEGDYADLLEEIGDIISVGYQELEDFDKIDASAINHVPKIHELAQEEGYFK